MTVSARRPPSGPLHIPMVDAWEVLRSVPVPLLLVLEDGFVLLANRLACELLERTHAELEGVPLDSFLAPFDELLHPSIVDGTSPKVQVTLPSQRDVTLSYAIAEMPELSHDEGTVVYAITLQDVTAFERLRMERDRLLQIATVHEVLPAILHEIKNPLAAIATTAEVLVEEATCSFIRESSHAILNEARRMRRLLQGIGAASGQLRTPNRHTAVDYALRELGTMLRTKAEAENVRLKFEIPDMPLLPLDSSILAAIVHNLVTNAIQACTPNGNVVVTASHDDRRNRLILRVADDGVGMSEDILAECRNLFFTTKPNGTGIGLTLCDRAVRGAGGKMTIESAKGKGTVITLSIPTARLEESGHAQPDK